jgi:hypothetical protein
MGPRGVVKQKGVAQTGDCLESTEFREISEICKTGIRQLLRSPRMACPHDGGWHRLRLSRWGYRRAGVIARYESEIQDFFEGLEGLTAFGVQQPAAGSANRFF